MLAKSSEVLERSPAGTRTVDHANCRRQTLGEIITEKLKAGAFHAPVRRLPPDVHLYSWGDTGGWLYLVNSGWVKCMTWAWNGKPCLLDISGPTAILGVSGFLTSKRAETAMTKSDTEISVISREQLDQIADDPLLHQAWHQLLFTYIVEQQQSLTHFVTLDSEHRLAMTLLRLGRKLGSRTHSGITIDCRITHDELAQMVGTTRSRIGYFLKRFECGHMVGKDGHSIVIHEDRLLNYVKTVG